MALLLSANPPSNIHLSAPVHAAILGGVVLVAVILTVLQRTVFRGHRLRLWVVVVLLADTLSWYAYQGWMGQFGSSAHLPLQLCDFTLWLAIVELFTLSAAVFDVCYYLALGGSTMALLTPNLWEPFPSISTSQFFIAHGLVVASVLYLAWSGLARPRRGSVGRAMLGLNVWALVAGTFDWVFHTDYMYLRQKPAQASLLNVLGPWPWYIASGEAVALLLFLLLYLPFRKADEGNG